MAKAITEPPDSMVRIRSKTLHSRQPQERVEAWPSGHTDLLEDAALFWRSRLDPAHQNALPVIGRGS